MSWWRRIFDRMTRRSHERDLDREIRAHLDLETEEQAAAGVPPDEAPYAAHRSFGNVALFKEATREIWGWSSLERLLQDLRYAARMLIRNPSFACAAVLSLGLGIGANSAVFSLINAVMIKPLPVHKPEQLVLLKAGDYFSYPMLQEIRRLNQVFSDICAWTNVNFHVTSGDEPELVDGLEVSGDYYSTLGVKAIIGRTLLPEDDDKTGASPAAVAVISYRYWQLRFAGNLAVVGSKIRVEGIPFTIIGVTPPEFFGADVGLFPDITIPIAMERQIQPTWGRETDGNWVWLKIIARRKLGRSLGQVRASLQVLSPRIMAEVLPPSLPAEERAGFLAQKIDVIPGATGFSDVRTQFSRSLFILLGVVGLVLLICCANIANLMLARTSARQPEFAIRAAIGAGRSRLLRQLFTESLLLAALGGAVGLLFAYWGSRSLLALISTGRGTIRLHLEPDPRVLVFTGLVAVLTSLIFGLAPALRVWHTSAHDTLRGSARSVGAARRQSNTQRFLIIAQTALSLLLLIGAGLFLQTFRNLETGKVGFNRNRVLLVFVDPARTGLKGDRLADFYETLRGNLKAAPGVQSVSFSRISPVSGDRWNGPVSTDRYTPHPNEDANVFFNAVGPDYFRTLGTPLLQGREFGSQDRENAPKAAIISASVARWLFPAGNSVGKHIRIADAPEAEVVGVAADAKYKDLREQETRTVYVPYRQEGLGAMTFEIRTLDGTSSLRPTIARLLQGVGSNIQFNVGNLTEQVDKSLARERLLAVLCTFFGLLALVLALVGLYGTMSYAVVRRTNEIGVRIALGAQRRDVVAMVIGQTIALVLIGLAIGLAAALALARVVASLLFGLTPNDPFTIATAALLMLAMAAVAGYFPARRASRIDPTEALRYE